MARCGVDEGGDVMRVLVCGGRDYTDWPSFRDALEDIALKEFPRLEEDEYGNFLYKVVIISGAAKGVDTLAIDWAVTNYCPFEQFPAYWDKYGSAAGSIRNQQMLDEGKP